MKRRKLMFFCLAALTLLGSVQVVAKNSTSGEADSLAVAEAASQMAKKTNESLGLFGLAYLCINAKINLFGVNFTSLKPGRSSYELGYMSDFKEHAIHKLDIGLNYTLYKNL